VFVKNRTLSDTYPRTLIPIQRLSGLDSTPKLRVFQFVSTIDNFWTVIPARREAKVFKPLTVLASYNSLSCILTSSLFYDTQTLSLAILPWVGVMMVVAIAGEETASFTGGVLAKGAGCSQNTTPMV